MSWTVQANLRSLKTAGKPEALDFGHHKAEVKIISHKDNNNVVAEYNGTLYRAIFNPFVAEFFVDDVDGYIGKAGTHPDDMKFIIEQALPGGTSLIAEVSDDPEYPGIQISLKTPGSDNVPICFAEYNSTKPAGKELCICAYAAEQDEPVYYESYSDPQTPSPNN